MVKLGETVILIPKTFGDTGDRQPKRPHRAKVVYIHPMRRFFVAEYTLPGGKVRESVLLFQERRHST